MKANWKTTLFGFAAGVMAYVAGGMDWKHALLGAGLAAFGAVSKDYTVPKA